jgi:hypothetical protein
MFENCQHKWSFEPTTEKECGYEDMID